MKSEYIDKLIRIGHNNPTQPQKNKKKAITIYNSPQDSLFSPPFIIHIPLSLPSTIAIKIS